MNEKATTSQPTYQQMHLTFPHADSGELAGFLEEIIREQDVFDFEGREFSIHSAVIEPDRVEVDIAVREEDDD